MSGADNLVFNALEKAISADWNNAQALGARTLATIMRHLLATRVNNFTASDDVEAVHPLISGLQAIPNGNNVTVQRGFLLQDSATLSPTPGTYDSSYRIALNLTDLTVTAPAPVSDTYYLLEAQMQEVSANDTRDVLNTGSGNFVGTSVPKVRTRTLNTQWVAGTTTDFPVPTEGNWVVLAGVFRPAGGGPVLSGHIRDMRLLPDVVAAEGPERTLRANQSLLQVTAADAQTLRLVAEAVGLASAYNRGLNLSVRELNAASPSGTVPSIVSLAADTWYYAYLAPWKGLAPRHKQANQVTRGVLVVSSTSPGDTYKQANGGTINYPAPYSTAGAIQIGEARSVGVLRSNAGGTGFKKVLSSDGRHRFASVNDGVALGSSSTILTTDHVNVSPSLTLFPAGIRYVTLLLSAQAVTFGAPASNTNLTFEITSTGPDGMVAYREMPATGGDPVYRWSTEIEIPFDGGYGYTLTVRSVNNTLSTATLVASLLGWQS